ncbi:1,2-dihydroxy-3-keto-5-methylthiopentene dioxygenase [Teichococcus oryzae]|jgi:1,2-dihydroxy-3-keto-5-methylthiopentene dioxygenase|uniref:Acireductone dioxygenase n=1 Tax=Teichococcus oryzae TaxID=1608942 RepID=A0A5B2TJE6_9PROT|nr:cupin domain-containing protein [Pseudoroseomonas oryzae]KAA2214601.1 acireductone dioxygenase [Pseudoroseomonas oryzae]
MSLLTIKDAATGAEELRSSDPDEIARALAPIGVRFERWPAADLPADAPAEAVLEAYRPQLDALMAGSQAGSADVIKMDSSLPQKEAVRAKFLAEHTHTEDEVRFFHEGSGNFIMHVNGKVYDAHCTRGDLISVPANTQHWFDAGVEPKVTALRIFTDTSGWTPHYTGTDISERFPAVTG